MIEADEALDGGCTCGQVRYRVKGPSMFVHCCHCRWCQRETGSAFVLNAMYETERLTVLQGAPEAVTIPTQSGKGQTVMRCPACKVALWSHYAGGGPEVAFVRVGTLDDPDRLPPDVHIFTESKQPWVTLADDGAPAFETFYSRTALWPEEARERYRAAKQKG